MKSDDKELNTFVSETTVYQKLWIAVSFIHSQAFVIYQKKKKKAEGCTIWSFVFVVQEVSMKSTGIICASSCNSVYTETSVAF